MIDEIIKQLKPLINGKLIYLSQYGSHLYGLDTENSDLDFRGVYIPTLDDIILKKDKDEINTELEIEIPQPSPTRKMDNGLEIVLSVYVTKKIKVDVKIFSLQKFIQLCSKADTNALDSLFSIDTTSEDLWRYRKMGNVYGEHKSIIRYIYENRNKLINTDRLESPITYAFKQATKYGLKGERLKVLQNVLQGTKNFLKEWQDVIITPQVHHLLEDDYYELNINSLIDNKHVKVDELDNKGKKELYLNVCGVQHQFNLELNKFIKRIEEKINKEYTSQRTIDAKDGNDWKALSHAIRVLLEVKELLDTGNIQFPLKDKDFLLDIKLGKVERKDIDEFFNKELFEILERVQKNELNWKYDEEFWNDFILKEIKNGLY